METRCLRGLDCFAVKKCSSNPSLAVASEGFFDSERFFQAHPGFELRRATVALLVWKIGRGPAKDEETRRVTEPLGPLPDPSPFGRTASATGPFAHTYQSRRLMRLSFFLV